MAGKENYWSEVDIAPINVRHQEYTAVVLATSLQYWKKLVAMMMMVMRMMMMMMLLLLLVVVVVVVVRIGGGTISLQNLSILFGHVSAFEYAQRDFDVTLMAIDGDHDVTVPDCDFPDY